MKTNTVTQLIKLVFLINIVFISHQVGFAQDKALTYQNLETAVLDYYPAKQDDVDLKSYRKGKHILENTYSAIKSDDKFVYADYWNIAVGFSYMGEKKEHIEIAFKKAVEEDWQSVCKIISSFGKGKDMTKNGLYSSIPEAFSIFYKRCKGSDKQTKPKVDLVEYSKNNSLDLNLVKTISRILEDDQRFRTKETKYYENPETLAKQNKLDRKNQLLIENLYKKHGKYIGKSLVGKKYKSVMWLVIQHSNLEMMEKYLPVIQKAFKDNELNVAPLKMLIDRVYSIKYQYQIFGSQGEIEMANDKKIRDTKKKFGIK